MSHAPLSLVLTFFAAGFGAAGASAATARPEPTGAPRPSLQRYPYDPACLWGRVSDGKGIALRCITADEAARLLGSSSRPPGAAPSASSAVPKGTAVKPASDPSTAPSARSSTPGAPAPVLASAAPAAPSSSGTGAPPPVVASATAASPSPSPPIPAPPSASPPAAATETPAAPTASDPLVSAIGPVIADTGSLPEAEKKLAAASGRYMECVRENGGLLKDRAELTIRFLVRERGRAEGPSVVKRRGISEAAGKCVADVVDRRYVGIPEAPMVGATLVVKFEKK